MNALEQVTANVLAGRRVTHLDIRTLPSPLCDWRTLQLRLLERDAIEHASGYGLGVKARQYLYGRQPCLSRSHDQLYPMDDRQKGVHDTMLSLGLHVVYCGDLYDPYVRLTWSAGALMDAWP